MPSPEDQSCLVVDLGGSSCRACLVSADGDIRRQARVAVPERLVASGGVRGGAEVDPRAAWGLVTAACRALDESISGGRPAQPPPAGLILSSLLGYILLDQHDEPLHPALIWMDTRAAEIARELAAGALADNFVETTGRRLAGELLLPRLVWFKRHRPELLAACRRVVGLKDWLVGKLIGSPGGPPITDYAHLNYTGLAGWRDGRFRPELAIAACLDPDRLGSWLPQAVSAAGLAGELCAEAAGELGLPAGLPVAVGSSDGTSAMYGAGVCLAGSAAFVSGTTDVCMLGTQDLAAAQRVASWPASGLSVNTGMQPGLYLAGGAMGLGGGAFAHFRGLAGFTDARAAEAAAAGVPAGSDSLLVLPGLSGERAPYWRERLTGGAYGLTLAHGPGHLVRACVEACAFRLRRLLVNLEKAGLRPDRLYVTGGGGSSALWNQVRADVIGRPVVELANPEATVLGSAMFLAKALGRSASLDGAARRWLVEARRFEPDPRTRTVYADGFARFERLLETLADMEDS